MRNEWDNKNAALKKAPLKCGRARFCRLMENALGNTLSNEHVKGFVAIQVTNMKTFQSRVLGIAYRKSARDRGLMINFCPFCGKSILWETAKLRMHEHPVENA